MSPRYEPRVRRKPEGDPPDVAAAEARMRDEHSRLASLQGSMEPYRLQHKPHERYDVTSEQFLPADPPGPGVRVPSYWFDLLLERDAAEREQRSFGRDPGHAERPWADDELAEARERLRAVREFDRFELDRLAQRDITSSGLSPVPAYRAFKRACARAGIAEPLPRLHDCRHAFATHLLSAGLTPHAVAALLGHTDAGLVLRCYGHALPDEVAGAGAALSAWRAARLA